MRARAPLIWAACGLIGAAQALTFAPQRLWWLAPFCLLALHGTQRGLHSPDGAMKASRSAKGGVCYGLGLAICGCHWLYLALYQGGHNPWTALVLTGLLMLLFALHYGAAFGLAAWFSARCGPAAWICHCLFFFPACWVLTEWLRRATDYDFPWLVLGESQVPGGLFTGYAPVGGMPGLSYLMLLCTGAIALLISRQRLGTALRAACLALPLLLLLGDLALRHVEWSEPDGEALHTVVLQAMEPGAGKAQVSSTEAAMRRLQGAAEQHAGSLIVTPETMIEAPANLLALSYWNKLHDTLASRHSYLLLGSAVLEHENGELHVYNSALALGPDGIGIYHKQHLVPVAEHMPFKQTLAGLYRSALNYPLQDQTPGTADQGKPVFLAGHMIAPLICYDAAYGAQAAREAAGANLIVNLSDDSWIDSETYFAQSEQMAQARAIEAARPLLRSNNMGRTSAIDAHGRIVAAAPARQQAELHVTVYPRKGETPYMRFGDAPVLILVVGTILAGALPWRRMRRSTAGAAAVSY